MDQKNFTVKSRRHCIELENNHNLERINEYHKIMIKIQNKVETITFKLGTQRQMVVKLTDQLKSES